jgi:predicted deacylase
MVESRSRRSERRAPLDIAGVQVAAGTRGRIDIPVARLPTGTWLRLPVSVIHGRSAGPTIWLSGTIHGDELNGIAIIREINRQADPKQLSGTILAVPIVNVFGLIIESRYLPDRRDLNRSFPGSKRGSLASQLAHLFVEQIVRRCEYGIDFHTGSGGRTNLPQIRCNVDDAPTLEIAERFGAPLILNSRRRPGSLRDTALGLGITTLLFEAGAAHHFDRRSIRTGIEGTRRVLHHLGMLPYDAHQPEAPSAVSRKSTWVRSRRGGLCQMSVELGDSVVKGQEVAIVYESLGMKDSAVRSSTDGMVIAQLNHAMVNRGEAIAHIAELE